jgi:hypothetical protein
MSRPKNSTPSVRITLTGSPKLRRYLEDLVEEEGYGKTPPTVALNLVWRGIEELIAKGVLEKRPGAYPSRTRKK